MEETFDEAVETWTCERVGSWLRKNGFQKYVDTFTIVHEIDGHVLLSLTEKDLREPPLQLRVLGDIKHLILRIQDLRRKNLYPNLFNDNNDSSPLHTEKTTETAGRFIHDDYLKFSQLAYGQDTELDALDYQHLNKSSYYHRLHSSHFSAARFDYNIPTELWKTALSFIYVFCVFMVTAFVMVVVHDRVPEMDKYPPLPDLFLDNMPYVPWAFQACEIVGLILGIMWCTVLIFHKHRFVLMRRMFSLTGTIFLLRCVTMLITSLSVPGKHLQCSGMRYENLYARLHRAFEICQGMGMSMQGVRTCGDYMFSGHTSIITLLNFFVTEYTPRKFYFVHVMSWCLNFFGIFFLLAAHEHYSIDVFMAFYLSSRLFMYYHTLANNRALLQADAKRTRIWFPLFAFFESKCQKIVPNHYEWPLLDWINLKLVKFRGNQSREEKEK